MRKYQSYPFPCEVIARITEKQQFLTPSKKMRNMNKNKPETCARCGQTKPITLSLVHTDGTQDPLCQNCATAFLESDENWPPKKSKKEHK